MVLPVHSLNSYTVRACALLFFCRPENVDIHVFLLWKKISLEKIIVASLVAKVCVIDFQGVCRIYVAAVF